eukprot:402191_1
MNNPSPAAVEVIISALLVVAPITRPAAIPPMDAFHESFLPRADSAIHSTDAKAAEAAAIQKAGRAIALAIAPESEVAFAAKRLTVAAPVPEDVEVTGSGYHASWQAAKNVPAPAPINDALNVLFKQDPCTT